MPDRHAEQPARQPRTKPAEVRLEELMAAAQQLFQTRVWTPPPSATSSLPRGRQGYLLSLLPSQDRHPPGPARALHPGFPAAHRECRRGLSGERPSRPPARLDRERPGGLPGGLPAARCGLQRAPSPPARQPGARPRAGAIGGATGERRGGRRLAAAQPTAERPAALLGLHGAADDAIAGGRLDTQPLAGELADAFLRLLGASD